jgi:hypothetical protein
MSGRARSDERVVVDGGQRPTCVAGIDHTTGFHQDGMNLTACTRAVLDSTWDYIQLPRMQNDVAVAHLNGELAIDD